MLDTPAEAGDEIHKQREKRDAARDRVARALAASSWDDRRHRIMEWRHYCPLGCHDSEQAAKEDICNDVDEAHLSMGVSVPALNRWLKIFDPEAF